MTDYEIIFCIVNAGFSDTVMSAAKEAGARGGTVLSARGTANKEAEELFQITIQPEKEIVMILVPSDIRDAVLHAVYEKAGLQTAGQGISFSMPVTNVAGLSSVSELDANLKKVREEEERLKKLEEELEEQQAETESKEE